MVDGDRSITTDENGRTVHQRALGEMFVVKQVGDEMQLTLDNGKGLEWHHRLDGVETVKLVPGPKGQMVRTASLAVWEGSRLTITFRHPDNPAASSTTQVLTLLSDETLRVEVGPQGTPKLVSVYGRIRSRRGIVQRTRRRVALTERVLVSACGLWRGRCRTSARS